MATLVISPLYEYGNFKSSTNPATTHKGHSLQGRKSPVINSTSQQQRRNSTSCSHPPKSDGPPHEAIFASSAQKASQHHHHGGGGHHGSDGRKLERALSEPSSERRPASSQQPNSSRYKTELCRPYEENGTCKYGDKCQFAHGVKELRTLARHPKYKTELCRSFHTTGLCPYGPRCHFIHNSDQTKATLLTSLTAMTNGGSGNNSSSLPSMATSRPKALSSSSLGSAGDLSPPSSHSGSPTLMKSTDDLFQFPSPTNFAFNGPDFHPVSPTASPVSHHHHHLQQQRSFMEYTTHEFNPDYYDTPSIFQERLLSSVFGSPVTTSSSSAPPDLDLDPASLCGSPNMDLFTPPVPVSGSPPSMDNAFGVPFQVFSLFGKQDNN